ncbi:MAG TPA: AMP-binding protein [Solirubrobacteraceae bacterium]|jgi:bile acid-coenzyme A ligase|nr:AMP-binding protein [Solirubrobacteraceae bacterium]
MNTFAERIAEHAAADPDAPAVTCAGASLTYAELADGAGRVAAHLLAAGARPGTTVVILLPNGPDFVRALLAAWWIGATPTPVSPKLPLHERTALVGLAEASAVVAEDVGDLAGAYEVLTVAQLAKPVDAVAPSSTPSPQWKAIGSGGSTGRPKLIVAEQHAVAEDVMGLGVLLRVPERRTMVVPGPLSHNAPFAALSVGLLRGNHVVLMARFDAAECLRLVAVHRAEWLYQVPTMMLRIWRLPAQERPAHDLSSLKVVFHMAAPCPRWLKQEWCDWLGPETILELYGGTELQAMTIVGGRDWLAHPGSVGPVVLGEMQVRDQDGNVLPPGETGEIWMRRGAQEPSPYHYRGAQARRARDSWESLGDMGHFDGDGFLYLADRASDMILVGGSNVYPAEVEAALDAHGAVRSSCVIGLPDEDLGNVPHAIVELAEEVSDEELLAWVRERVAGYKAPRSVERVDHPLRDDAGKVRRSQLRAERVRDGG